MKLYLPWKLKGYDRDWYQAVLDIRYYSNQTKELEKRYMENILANIELERELKESKILKRGKRKCDGHKKGFPAYSDEGQCSICGGYKK